MNERLRTIVTGYDFSAEARHALEVALELARRTAAKLWVATAVPSIARPRRMDVIEPEAPVIADAPFEYEQRVIESAGRKIRQTVAELGGSGVDLNVEVALHVGKRKPFAFLLQTANFRQADLIVVGATGAGAIRRWLVGSTAERLVRKSRFPVLVVSTQQPLVPKQIACAVDFSDASRLALSWSAGMARLFSAQLSVVYVLKTGIGPQVETLIGIDRMSLPHFPERDDEDRKWAKAALADFVQGANLDGLAWSAQVIEGSAPAEILSFTKLRHVDLLCMGSLGRDRLEGMVIGNTAEKVLRALPCSLLAIKPDDFVLKHAFYSLS